MKELSYIVLISATIVMLCSNNMFTQKREGIAYPSNLTEDQKKEEFTKSIQNKIDHLNNNDQGINYSFIENPNPSQYVCNSEYSSNYYCIELCWDLHKKTLCKNSAQNLELLLKLIRKTGNKFTFEYYDYMYYEEFQTLPRSRILKVKEEYLDKLFTGVDLNVNVQIGYFDFSETEHVSDEPFTRKLIVNVE